MSHACDEAALRDAAHDAFLACWRGVESDKANPVVRVTSRWVIGSIVRLLST